jgi:PhnB protein
MPTVKPIPEGFHSVTPYLVVSNAVKAIEFYAKALGAKTVTRMPGMPQWGAKSPKTLGGSPVSLHLYVEDVDAVFQKATSLGCETQMPPTDQFWGDRYCKLVDPFGHIWGIATRKEDVSPQEMQRRQADVLKQMSQGGSCET